MRIWIDMYDEDTEERVMGMMILRMVRMMMWRLMRKMRMRMIMMVAG